jgi:uncharacterized lipoprotein NlpE involved in copper resistance
MKRWFVTLGVVAMLVFVGCDNKEENSLISPQSESLGSVQQSNWIVLPAPSNASLQKVVNASKLINGSEESLIEINTGYAGGSFGWVSITANARFPRNSFKGSRYVSMSIDTKYANTDFSPSGTFLKPVIYNMTIMGVDLKEIEPSNVKFVYMAPDGNYYPVKYQKIFVEKQSGKLQVINAELPHFSRYGFTN